MSFIYFHPIVVLVLDFLDTTLSNNSTTVINCKDFNLVLKNPAMLDHQT